ncbi:hypothetical protein TNCV_5063441 [Trichonephila clavipes]|nr:hypothetical protein TNCV_5063441 [Trichonephila clavipes]
MLHAVTCKEHTTPDALERVDPQEGGQGDGSVPRGCLTIGLLPSNPYRLPRCDPEELGTQPKGCSFSDPSPSKPPTN